MRRDSLRLVTSWKNGFKETKTIARWHDAANSWGEGKFWYKSTNSDPLKSILKVILCDRSVFKAVASLLRRVFFRAFAFMTDMGFTLPRYFTLIKISVRVSQAPVFFFDAAKKRHWSGRTDTCYDPRISRTLWSLRIDLCDRVCGSAFIYLLSFTQEDGRGGVISA